MSNEKESMGTMKETIEWCKLLKTNKSWWVHHSSKEVGNLTKISKIMKFVTTMSYNESVIFNPNYCVFLKCKKIILMATWKNVLMKIWNGF